MRFLRFPRAAGLQFSTISRAVPSKSLSTSTAISSKEAEMKSQIKRSLLLVGLAAFLTASAAEAAGPFQFFSVTPCRIVDTRGPNSLVGGPALTSGVTRNFPIDVAPAACGVPSTAKAAVLNVTLVSPSLDGFLSIWPFNTTPPLVSTINAAAGEPAIANGAIVPLTTDVNFNISVIYGTAVSGGSAHVILDVTGYFQ